MEKYKLVVFLKIRFNNEEEGIECKQKKSAFVIKLLSFIFNYVIF
jgi:hypothetical protein